MSKKEKSDAKILYDELCAAHAAIGTAKTLLRFHGRPSAQLDNCIKVVENAENRALDCAVEFEDKYWSKK